MLHAPRQTGKTSSLLALRGLLNSAAAGAHRFENKGGRDRGRAITRDDIDDAQEALILRRETHLDQLTGKLGG